MCAAVASVFDRRLGGADCEAFRGGFLSQPVNSLSGIAYLLVGGAFAVWAARQPRGQRLLPLVYAVAIAANVVGTLLFHGPASTGAKWSHDLALLAPLVFIVVFDLANLRPLSDRAIAIAVLVVVGVLGLFLAAAPQASVGLSAVFAALVLGLELAVVAPRYAFRRARQVYALGIAALLFGGAFEVLGRTGGPLCDPGSWLQGHAAWHVCTAVVLGAWGVAALVVADRRRAPRERIEVARP